jgi:hypothetical protein
MSSAEYAHWQALNQISPIGASRWDDRFASVVKMIADVWGGGLSWEDARLSYEERTEQTEEDMAAVLRRATELARGKHR